MLRSIDKPYPMGAIREEGAPRGHSLDVLQVSLPVQLQFDAQPLCNQLDQRFRLVDVELIDDEDPPRIWVGGYRLCDVRGEVLIGATRAYMEGAITLPVATSRLANKHRVPWRSYSCSWRSISPGRIGSFG